MLLYRQVLQAVQHAHANLVIHRDLKPANSWSPRTGRRMLLDFGIAKLLQDEHTDAQETELTRIGGRASPALRRPEQLAGTPLTIATDVWALGVLAYELLAGTRPFRGGQPREIEQAILADDPPPPAGIDADLATIVLKALKKPPADRYATVAAFADDLGRWLEGRPVLARRDSAWYRTRKFIGRHRLGVAVTAAVAVLLVATAVVALQQARNAIEQARIAKVEARTAEAVQGFLEGLFHANPSAQSDPVRARQRTAKELLDEGAARIDKTLDDVPEAKARGSRPSRRCIPTWASSAGQRSSRSSGPCCLPAPSASGIRGTWPRWRIGRTRSPRPGSRTGLPRSWPGPRRCSRAVRPSTRSCAPSWT